MFSCDCAGEPVRDAATLKRLLVAQVTAPVRFDACVRRAECDFAPTQYFEFGPGRVLSSLIEAHYRVAASASAAAAAAAAATTGSAASTSNTQVAASTSFTSTATRFSSATSAATAADVVNASSTSTRPSIAALGGAEQLVAYIKTHR